MSWGGGILIKIYLFKIRKKSKNRPLTEEACFIEGPVRCLSPHLY